MNILDTFELKREQAKLARKIILRDDFNRIKTIGGIDCAVVGDNILAYVVVCEFPSMEIVEKKKYLLTNPLPYRPGFQAYREMPAMIEAFNSLEQEPDLILVSGTGVAHPRKLGIASHLGLALNKPTIGVTQKLVFGNVDKGKIMLYNDIVGFEIITREHANPVYVSPGHLVSLGSTLDTVSKIIKFPHKMPEPLHLAHKFARKKVKKIIAEVSDEPSES